MGTNALGRAYLFDGQNGQLKLTFNNPEPANQDDFGEALTGGDGRVFITTNGIIDRIYAFSADTGEPLYTAYHPDGPRGGSFGNSLAYGHGGLLVSNPSHSVPFDTVGLVYLLDASTGQIVRPIENPEPKAGDLFGIGPSLAIFGNRAVVGAEVDDLPGDDRPDGDNPGRVWVFDRLSGQTAFVLDNPNPSKGPPFFFSDSFGFTVAANEHVIAVGAQEDDTSGISDSGTVYVFDGATGALRHTLFGPHLELDSQFGRSISVTPAGNVLVGARTTVDEIPRAGHAYLFDGLTGNLLLDIPHPEATPSAAFGWSVAAIDDSRLVVGDFLGGVYVIEGIPEPASLTLAIGTFIALAAIYWARALKGRVQRR
jgi:outer membrane protein assembly factor BamB